MQRILIRSLRGTALFAVPLALIAVLGDALASPADLRVIVSFLVTLVLVLSIQSFSGNSGIVSRTRSMRASSTRSGGRSGSGK